MHILIRFFATFDYQLKLPPDEGIKIKKYLIQKSSTCFCLSHFYIEINANAKPFIFPQPSNNDSLFESSTISITCKCSI
jgi:hypothetical protein